MRKSLLLLLPFALIPLAGLALPASAESGEGSCAPETAAGPIDLNAVPTKAVTGRLTISGIAVDDECDDTRVAGKSARAMTGADEGFLEAEGEGQDPN